MHNQMNGSRNKFLWIGIAAGAAAGIIIAVTRSRRPHDRWSTAKDLTRRVADNSQDLAERGKEIISRAQNIYEEGRKIVEDAADLWTHGRRLVRA
jgi:gas vesicle protein